MIMPKKLAIDLEYIKNQSLLLDMRLIVQTFLCLFQGGEYAEHEKVGGVFSQWQ